MKVEPKKVTVKILGKEYLVACRVEEEQELLESAQRLDRKMREIRDTGKVVGMERIAVMAALNIAHELVQSEKSSTAAVAEERLRALRERIDSALADEGRQLQL